MSENIYTQNEVIEIISRRDNLYGGGCAICGAERKNHKDTYDKETGSSKSFTHSFDSGNFTDLIFK